MCTKQDQLLQLFFQLEFYLLLVIDESLSGHKLDGCGSNPSDLETSFYPHHLKTSFAIRPCSSSVEYISAVNFPCKKRSDTRAGHSPQVLVSGYLVMLPAGLL